MEYEVPTQTSFLSTGLRLLTQPEVLPALVNCAIGKDRTGILIALVQSVLGHSDDYIADDYALSEVSRSISKTYNAYFQDEGNQRPATST